MILFFSLGKTNEKHIGNQIKPIPPANERAGKIGENETKYYLESLIKNDEYLLSNVLIPYGTNKTTEIDHILVTRKGIFCIETKRWIGHIYGRDNEEDWIQKYDDPMMNDRIHQNPVIQNEKHCRHVDRVLNEEFDVDNIVIFVDLLEKTNIKSQYCFSIDEFISYYHSLNDDEVSEEDIKYVYELLKKYVATEEQLLKHKNSLKKLNRN